ncbi:hypothetical protein L218DRAFT_887720, partial [Marasmius fiardii PR-910]
MAICSKFIKPDIFITITADPSWPEIQAELITSSNGGKIQEYSDRPDIVARVFNLKLNQLLRDIIKEEIFGKVVGLVYTIEFQKRSGLCHAHILVFLDTEWRVITVEQVDKISCARIPNQTTQPKLYETV